MNPHPNTDLPSLDLATGGAFTAATSGERAARVRAWLATQPEPELMAVVYRELSARDKGAAKALREKLDDLKRERHQSELVEEWVQKGEALRLAPKMALAQALAWQRDAAKAGAPLSKEPLAGLKQALNERIRVIEELQHHAQVLRESAVLLGQRSEVLATKPWQEARSQSETLGQDVTRWLTECDQLTHHSEWPCVDPKYPPALQANAQQVQAVFESFSAALDSAQAAAADAELPLPPVTVWAEEIRRQRGQASVAPQTAAAQPAKPRIDPHVRAQAVEAVTPLLRKLEEELAQGHGKATAGAANALRQALREHEAALPERVEHQIQSALAAASELEGWQRWRADQLRTELVAKAEALFKPAASAAEGQAPAEPQPAFGGRKMQETLRELREQWKQTDQGGLPNHALWKRFDQACNRAHKVVEAWLEKVRAESTQHREARLQLIEELKAWAAEHAQGPQWKGVAQQLAGFANRWRESGHVSEKVFAELQPLWKAAYQTAQAPFAAAQKAAQARRQALIEEAQALSQRPGLPLDDIKALQQRWQAESQTMALDRRTEQKLWDAFRAPIDALFERKSQERAQQAAAVSAVDRAVLQAAQALEAACKAGDAAAIRAATHALQEAGRGAPAPQAPETSVQSGRSAPDVPVSAPAAPVSETAPVATALDSEPHSAPEVSAQPEAASPEVASPAAQSPEDQPAEAPRTVVAPVVRKVVAVRGDDRPGMKKAEPAPMGKGPRKPMQGRPERSDRTDRAPRNDRFAPADRGLEARGPRLGDAAFRAMRHAQDMAEQTMRRLAAQAHGEVLTQVLQAWQERRPEPLPSARELGSRVTPAQRQSWAQALAGAPAGSAEQALLRLEIAAEAPTPAQHLEARRAMQLTLLTQRHQASPRETWSQDVEKVLASPHNEDNARRLQTVLKSFLR